MKYGDEKKILEETFPIVEALYSTCEWYQLLV